MKERRLFILAVLVILCAASSCHQEHGPYDGVETYGTKNITIVSLPFDTMRVDAKYTSFPANGILRTASCVSLMNMLSE